VAVPVGGRSEGPADLRTPLDRSAGGWCAGRLRFTDGDQMLLDLLGESGERLVGRGHRRRSRRFDGRGAAAADGVLTAAVLTAAVRPVA